jgi:hypothetical protein
LTGVIPAPECALRGEANAEQRELLDFVDPGGLYGFEYLLAAALGIVVEGLGKRRDHCAPFAAQLGAQPLECRGVELDRLRHAQ